MRLVIATGVLLALGAGFLVAYRLISGKSLGLRSLVTGQLYAIRNYGRAVLNNSQVKASGGDEPSNIIFLHHSTGENLVEQGQVRTILTQKGYQFWDHGYNETGLRGPDGKLLEYNYGIPDDNTNPGGFYRIFQQAELPLPLNAYSGLLQHDVIVFKSCFRPANNIRSDEQLTQYKAWYKEMRTEMASHPEKVFIIVTPPPLNPAETNTDEARRARDFANWLKSEEYLEGHANIYTFDYFDRLAESDPASPEHNMLRIDFRDGDDSHPNYFANETMGPVFADFIDSSITDFKALDR